MSYAVGIIDFIHCPLHKDKVLLQQKYLEEGLSIRQISEQIFCFRSAVRTGLIKAGIKPRAPHKPHGQPSQVRYG